VTTEPTVLVTELADGVSFRIHLQPRASRTEISGIQGEEIKMRVTSPPVDDAANLLCIEFLARRLGVAKSRVSIIAGSKSRHKTIKISGVTREAVLALVKP
jgi:uncharacterized protein